MKTTLALLFAFAAAEVMAQTNLTLRVAERKGDAAGRPGFYAEVLKDGSNFVACITRDGKKTEIGFWFDQGHTLCIVDTNNDGRSDEFWFSTDLIPQDAWLRNITNGLDRIDPIALRKTQEFSGVMKAEFPKIIAAAVTSNSAAFWGRINNIVERADEIKSQQGPPEVRPPAAGGRP